ncbi:NAD(P)H-binding protein [Streptacidiphilus fuscans]|uniref:NAD(P)H-binding protein n=1 Tax=Streptacidiphilus fuscans TaxID=2789292 RepID=A0A931BAL2_9ACTN|nr:NAD(P)H-binding protein [Streptacidiphilus fuscans]MBF9072637.1 NAD(P)H-binding protein [Streptacidiphilus fuscans]
MILVTGASGTVGREVAGMLAARGRPVRLMTRSPQALRREGGIPGTEVVRGDFDDPDSLAAAFTGIRAVLLITTDPLRPDHDVRAIEAAQAVGVRHVVKLSALAVLDPLARDLITRWQRANEELLLSSGLGWTVLRPRAFMSNTLSWAERIHTGRPIPVLDPHARTACIAPQDLAEVAVLALTDPAHQGHAYALTGPEALSATDQADRLEQVLGRRPLLETVGADLVREHLLRRYPEPLADALIASQLRQAAGAKAEVDPTVAALTGRPATTYRQWAADHAAAFAR